MNTSAAPRLHLLVRRALVACAMITSPLVLPRSVTAQEGSATLKGVVFDSTKMEALPGARVAVLGTSAMADADADGQFELDGIPAGAHWVSFFHPRLQELGVSAPSRQVTFEDGRTVEVELSVPSERTLLMGWCMAEQTQPGRGALAGVVADSLTGVPLPRAVVTAQPLQRRVGDPAPIVTRTDEVGYYRICDLPVDREVKVQAEFGRSAGRTEVVSLEQGGAEIRDLKLLLSAEGTLVGAVHDYTSGRPLVGATVAVLGTQISQLTDSTGSFVLDGLPPGRHLITTAFLGYAQHTDSVTVFSQETVDTEIRLSQEAVELEGLTVTARTRFGQTRVAVDKRSDVFTRTEIEPLLGRAQNMGDLLRYMNAPGLSIREVPDGGRDRCGRERTLRGGQPPHGREQLVFAGRDPGQRRSDSEPGAVPHDSGPLRHRPHRGPERHGRPVPVRQHGRQRRGADLHAVSSTYLPRIWSRFSRWVRA